MFIRDVSFDKVHNIINTKRKIMLIILGGLPGVGKSTIAKKLCENLKAVYLRIDSIEQAIKEAAVHNPNGLKEVIAEGYMTAYAIAKDNLEIGLTVVTDSVNSIAITREDYQNIANSLNKPFLEIELICSDQTKHQHRVETRTSSIPNQKLPTWQDVLNREYEPWQTKHLTVDTAFISVDEAVEIIIKKKIQTEKTRT